MSIKPAEPTVSDANATVAEPRAPGTAADTVAEDATGEFTADPAPALTPVRTVADPSPATAGLSAPSVRDDARDATVADGPARPASAAALAGAAVTEVMASTGAYVVGGGAARPPDGLAATVAGESEYGATVDLAATAAFELGTTEAGSDSVRRNRPVLAATEAMATSDFDTSAPTVPSRRRAADPPGRCGRYVLRRFHAKGGMGEIWIAEDPDIGRPVALKRMLSERPDQVCRFRVEAQVTGQLEHPGIVPVHELGVNEQGQTFYAMKFVQGRTLKTFVEEYHERRAAGRASDVEQVHLLQVFLSLCQTVAYAHSRGVLHRDLKPDNVMLGEFGETIVLDWGIAKVLDQPDQPDGAAPAAAVHLESGGEGTETRAGAIMGTPAYMAPEVAAGRNAEVDFQSDVYLLGATLYEMLTARPPRTGRSAIEMIRTARTEAPARVRTVEPNIPRALDGICFKAMAQQKQDRYRSARELADDVQRYLAGEPVTAYREDFWQRASRWARRHRLALSRSAAAVMLVTASGWVYATLRQVQHERAGLARRVAAAEAVSRARTELKTFLRLADEASFYAANTDQMAENVPYTDAGMARRTAQAALALASQWGPALERLPLDDERPQAAREWEQLNQLALHLDRLEKSPPPARARTAGDPAPAIRAGRVPVRLVSLDRPAPGAGGATAPRRPGGGETTALGHFFLGESYRVQATLRTDVQSAKDAWKPDPELLNSAIAEYRKALALDPTHYWSQYQLGRCYLGAQRLAEAVEALGGCIARRPDAPWAYSTRGFARLLRNEYADAEADLNRAAALSPENRLFRLNRGVLYYQQRKHAQALADFAAVLEPPGPARLIQAHYYRGLIYAHLGDNARALAAFDALLRENAHYRAAYYYRAQVHFANGDEALALEDLDRYIANGGAIDRDGWMIHGVRGHLLRAMHGELPLTHRADKWAQALATLAIEELKQAVILGGRAYDVFDDLGAMLEHAGQVREAIAAYSQGIAVAPDNVKLRNKRAWALEGLGRHDVALADFTAAAQADPTNGEAHAGAGYVRAVLKQVSEAQREADLALVHGADEFLVLHNIACIYATLADGLGRAGPAYQDVAIAILRRAVARWKDAETPLNEIDLIKGESAFRSLRERADFRELLGTEPARKAG